VSGERTIDSFQGLKKSLKKIAKIHKHGGEPIRYIFLTLGL